MLGLFAIVRGGSNLARCLAGLGDAGQTLTNQRPHSRSRSRLTWGVSLMSNKLMIALQTAPVAAVADSLHPVGYRAARGTATSRRRDNAVMRLAIAVAALFSLLNTSIAALLTRSSRVTHLFTIAPSILALAAPDRLGRTDTLNASSARSAENTWITSWSWAKRFAGSLGLR